MDLINDLGSDLAIAFLVEKKHTRKIALREALVLIDRVRTELQRFSHVSDLDIESAAEDHFGPATSH